MSEKFPTIPLPEFSETPNDVPDFPHETDYPPNYQSEIKRSDIAEVLKRNADKNQQYKDLLDELQKN